MAGTKGRSGRHALPTEILKIRGSKRAIYNRPRNEPQPEKGRPTCPQWLSADEKSVWRRLVPMLDQMRVLSKDDVFPVERYCVTYIRWRRAIEFLREHGETYTAGECLRAFPQTKIAQDLSTALTGIEDRFGMSPSARTRISARPVEQPKTGVAKFFGHTA